MEPNSTSNSRQVALYKYSLATLLESIDFSSISKVLWGLVMIRYPSILYDRGRKPHHPTAMFKALLLKEMMQIQSRRKLASFLAKNEYWLKKCGFKSSPHHDCFSEFIKRLGKELFERVFNELVKQLKEMGVFTNNFIAVDSTPFKAYSRYREGKEPSDKDAGLGITSTKEWVFGYKLHLACDAEAELPLSFKVTPANTTTARSIHI